MTRIGVIGLGTIGQTHLAALRQLQVAELYGADPSVSARDSARPHTARSFADFETMLSEAQLDGVVIATPPRTHRDIAVACLDGPDDADRIFYGATGEPLVTAGEVARIVMELVPGSRIEIPDALSANDQIELPYRGRLSIESNRTQLGWEPRFKNIRDGLADYVERYRAFLAASS